METENKYISNIFEIADNDKKDPKKLSIGDQKTLIVQQPSSQCIDKEFKSIPKLYSELEELVFTENEEPLSFLDSNRYEWKVVSRWIKYEQTVNRITNKWGDPYIGPLLYQELIHLKNNLQTGSIILNCKHYLIEDVIDEVLDDFVNRGQMIQDHKDLLKKVMLTQYRSQRAFAGVLTGRKNLRPDNLPSTKGNSRLISVNSISENLSGTQNKTAKNDFKFIPGQLQSEKNINSQDSHIFYIGTDQEVPNDHPSDKHFQSKLFNLKNHYIQQNAKDEDSYEVEANLMMVGEVEFLERHVIAFVRLMGDGFVYYMDGFRMKIRFLFIFLGPSNKFSYLEVGRCMGCLMNNKEFKASAYRAKTSYDVIKAITHYSNSSLCMVLPIGDYGSELLAPMIDWTEKKMLKKKKIAKKKKMVRNDSNLPITSQQREISDHENCSDAESIGKENDDKKPNPFEPTGCLFGSLVKETKYRYSQYWSDIKDGLNLQCLIAAVFTFTICFAPALTFGGILADKTGDYFGINEMIIATSTNGLFFALFSGQPLMIFGPTGPLLVFEEFFYIVCVKILQIDFFAARCWVAIWILVISVIVISCEFIRVIHHVTRFTEEIFATLIACCFLVDVIKKCVKYFMYDPLYKAEKYCSLIEDSKNLLDKNSFENITTCYGRLLTANESCYTSPYYKPHPSPEPNIALISVILIFCTFFLAHCLKALRKSKFLRSYLRRTISDVGILISIFIMMLLDYFIRTKTKIDTQKLDIPDTFTPTNFSRKSWFVSPFGNNFEKQEFFWWIPLFAILPAFLIWIILFFEVELIGIILTNKHRKLRKGTGFNLDLLLGAFLMVINSLFGLPWLCAAPVRTLAHWASLTTYSQSNIPGEKNKLISVKEQRITGIIVHIAIGLCLFAKFFLKLIPVPVLFGLLLYFGVVSLSGTQLYERFKFLLTPFKHTPNLPYSRGVRVIKRNVFTIIQIFSVFLLLLFKSIAIISLGFPILLIMLVIIRKYLLPKFYSDRELEQLDDEEEQIVDNNMIHDFYELTHLPL